jgi:GNAT superfamily N-acetyltransferase
VTGRGCHDRQQGKDKGRTVKSAHIIPARATDDVASAIKLFRAYSASLGIDLSFQEFESEIAAMPGQYAPPTGELLLARDDGSRAVGCVALRPIQPDGCCEMKRLYVSPVARGSGVGLGLTEAIITTAERIGYHEMRLVPLHGDFDRLN